MAMSHQIHTYTELRHQIHDDLRIQHPDWILPNGESPMCDSYEARLMELLDLLSRRQSSESLEHGQNRSDTFAVLYLRQQQNQSTFNRQEEMHRRAVRIPLMVALALP